MNQLGLGFPEAYIPRSSYRITAAPAVEPLTATEVRDALGLGDAPSSGELERMITTARTLAEAYTGRAFIDQTIEMQLDTFPAAQIPWWDGVREGARRSLAGEGPIPLFRPPVSAITSITYVTSGGATLTVDDTTYYLDEISEPNRVLLVEGQSWPVDPRMRAAVKITYTAGYGATAADVPAAIAEAILAHLHDRITRPNDAVTQQTIDNASTAYGNATADRSASAGALRGGSARILDHLRVLPPV